MRTSGTAPPAKCSRRVSTESGRAAGIPRADRLAQKRTSPLSTSSGIQPGRVPARNEIGTMPAMSNAPTRNAHPSCSDRRPGPACRRAGVAVYPIALPARRIAPTRAREGTRPFIGRVPPMLRRAPVRGHANPARGGPRTRRRSIRAEAFGATRARGSGRSGIRRGRSASWTRAVLEPRSRSRPPAASGARLREMPGRGDRALRRSPQAVGSRDPAKREPEGEKPAEAATSRATSLAGERGRSRNRQPPRQSDEARCVAQSLVAPSP